MLDFLVTSTARRRLVLLLWGEGARGSASELAVRAGVSFASAHDELKAMQRLGLVVSERQGTKEVLAADAEYEGHELMRMLATSTRARASAREVKTPDIERRLKTLGAPLRGVEPLALEPLTTVETLIQGAAHARRDPTVARTLPICVWNVREDLDAKLLAGLSAPPEDKHALGFLIELAGEIGGDRRLQGIAEVLRDGRIRSVRPFFFGGARREAKTVFPLAQKWGFEMNTDHDAFAALFHKYVSP